MNSKSMGYRQFRSMWSIFKRDTGSLIFQPFFFSLLAFLTIVLSAVFYNGLVKYLRSQLGGGAPVSIHDALFQGHFATLNFFLLFFSASFALKLLTEEKRQRTLDLLWTSAIWPWQILLSKFLAGFCATMAIIGAAMIYPLSLGFYTHLDSGTLFSSLLGLTLMGALYLMNSLIVAAVTQSYILTIVGSLTLNFLIWLISAIPEILQSPIWVDVFEALSAGQHLVEMLAGQVTLYALVFFILALVVSFFTAEGFLKVSMLQQEGLQLKKGSYVLLAMSFVLFVGVGAGKFIFDVWVNLMSMALGLGVALLLGLLATERQFFRQLMVQKRSRVGLQFGVQWLSILVVSSCVGYLSYVFGPKWDLTQNQKHSLSPASQAVIREVSEPVEFIFVYLNDEMRNSAEKQILALVDLYTYSNNRMSYRAYNAYQSPEVVSALKLQQNGTGLFVKMKDKFERISDLTEETVTNALIRLKQSQPIKIYFVQGHGEATLQKPQSTGQRSLSELKNILEQSYFKTQEINLYESLVVPADATALVVAGPQLSFSTKELETLKSYIEAGGKVLFALEPLFDDGLTAFLESYGFKLSRDVLFDDIGRMLGYGPNLVTGVVQDKDQIVTASLDPQFVYYFMQASPVQLAPLDQRYKTFEWIRTQGSVSARHSYKEAESPKATGLMNLISGVQSQEKKYRLIVAGDVDFLQDNLIVQSSNRQLAVNLVNFLTHDQKVLDIPNRASKVEPLQIPVSTQPLYLISFMAYPMFFVVTALILSLRKRTR